MRPKNVYERIKNVRTWTVDNHFIVESKFEDPIHLIILTVEIDIKSKKIISINANFVRSPYPDICPKTSDIYQKLIGLEIKPGFSKKVVSLIQKQQGCVHINALLKEAGDAVVQSNFYLNFTGSEGKQRRKELMRFLRNHCIAYSDLYND